MIPTRVLVANRPRLIRELVTETISDQPDINVVGEIEQENELQDAVLAMKPDVLIVALDRSNHLPLVCESILRSYPAMRIVAIASDRNASMLYRVSLTIESTPIEASEAGVLGAIRGTTQSVDQPQ